MKIGVAMSGGGHRASAWGIGVLAALVDTGLGDQIVSVSSVSGGSITNGVIAQNLDLRTASADQFDEAVAGALRSYATVGLFPHGPLTRRYFRSVIALAVLAAAGMIAFVTLLVIAALTDATSVVIAGGVVAVVVLVSLVALMWQLSRRGTVVRSAIARTHFHGTRTTSGTPLAAVDRTVNHVILATDLEAGDQFYLAPRFLYGYREGIADPAAAGTSLADAVQASAGLPGAFPPVRLPTGSFTRPWAPIGAGADFTPPTPPKEVWLSDGGVYDNMAEQWEGGIDSRLRRWAELADVQEPADVVIVANASAGWDWRPFGSTRWPMRELTGLRRVQGVQYDVSTARRRNALVQTWMRSDASGSGQRGVIVMVDRDPHATVRAFARGSDDRAVRAREALDYLGDGSTWRALAERNAGVGTVLDALGVGPTVDLIEQSYVSTVVGMYVLHGLGRLAPFDRRRFEQLCAS